MLQRLFAHLKALLISPSNRFSWSAATATPLTGQPQHGTDTAVTCGAPLKLLQNILNAFPSILGLHMQLFNQIYLISLQPPECVTSLQQPPD